MTSTCDIYPWHHLILDHVRQQLSAQRMSHALLYRHRPDFFDEALGWQIAALLLCDTKDPDAVQHRRLIDDRSHPNVLFLDVVSNPTKPPKDRVGITHVRALEQQMWQTAVFDKPKVAYIQGMDMLSLAGQNALLKTLEEPPENVFFVLSVCDVSRVLPTIMSRVQRLQHARIDDDMQQQIHAWLQQELSATSMRHNSDDVANIAASVQFKPARALSLLQSPEEVELFRHEKQTFARFMSGECPPSTLLKGNDSEVLSIQLLRYRGYIDHLIRLLFAKTTQQADKAGDNSVEYVKWKGISMRELYDLRDRIMTLQKLQNSNVNMDMQLTTSLMDWQNDRRK